MALRFARRVILQMSRNELECTACGEGFDVGDTPVVISQGHNSSNFVYYAVAHDREDCLHAVT